MRFSKTKRRIFKALAVFFCLALLSTQTMPQEAFASRSSAGGGELDKFSWGSFVMSAGISVGSTVFGGAIDSALKGAWNSLTGSNSLTTALQATGSLANLKRNVSPGFLSSLSNYFSGLSSLKNVASTAISGYTTFTAVSEAGRAASMMGAYYGRKPSSTFLLSNIVSGAVSGLLNPAIALGDTMPKIPAGDILAQTAFEISGYNMAKGAFIGSLKNFAEAGVIVAIDGNRINEDKQPGALAQVAGLWSGVAAGNFARGLVNPETWRGKSLGIYKREIKTIRPFLTDEFYKLEAGPSGIDRKPFEADTIQDWAEEPNIEFRPIGEGVVNVVDINAQIGASQIGNRLLEATFIKTGDMWPQLTTRSLSIVASNALRENRNGLASFVSSAVEGIAGPLFSRLADMYALRPGIYLGEDKIANRVAYDAAVRESAYKYRLDKVSRELYDIYEVHKDDPDTLRSNLQTKLQDIPGGQDINIPKEVAVKQIIEGVIGEGTMAPTDVQDLLDELVKRHEREEDPALKMLGIAHTLARMLVEAEIKKKETLADVFKAAGTDKYSLAFRNAFSGLKFGLIEGAIHGGVNFLTSKFSEKNDLLVAAALSYGATMLTGAIRGVILNLTWEPSKKDGKLVWMDRLYEFEPQPYKGDDWFEKKIHEYTYPLELERYKKFAELTGLKPKEMDRMIVDPDTGKTEKIITVGIELGTLDDRKPGLKDSIFHSLMDSNYTFLKRAVSFGIPQIPAKSINTMVMSDYFRRLNSYAMSGANPDWLTSGINLESINASAFTISNNILTSLSAMSSSANAFNLERRRQTWTTSPRLPMIMQGLDYKAWALAIETRYYLAYEVLAGSRTGESFLREGQ